MSSSMADKLADKKAANKAKASALLALAVSRESAAYAPPSDEELAILLESGITGDSAMDATRKAQIMDGIANDSATFSRWMLLVEAAETLELAGFAEVSTALASSSSSNSILSKLKSFFSNPMRGFATAGGSLVAASALVLMVSTTDQYDTQLDELYGDYGSQWQSSPAPQSTTRSVGGALKKALSIEDLLLREGVVDGLNKLGPQFVISHLSSADSDNWSDDIDRDLEVTLDAVGQIAAISFYKCSLGAEAGYFDQTLSLLLNLQPTLAKATDQTSQAISKSLQRSGDAETKVCRVSKLIIARVTD